MWGEVEQLFVWPSAATDNIQPWNVTSEPQMTSTLEHRENTLDARHKHTLGTTRCVSAVQMRKRNRVKLVRFPRLTVFLSFLLFCTDILCCLLRLQGAIIIHEVYEEGAASKDGRLWAGDQILEVRCTIMAHITAQINKRGSLRSFDIKSLGS